MDGQSILDLSIMDPGRRRRWLFSKALENAPLAEALSLAQAAEDFLSRKAQETADRMPDQTPATGFELKPEPLAETPLRTLVTPEVRNGKLSEALEGLSSLASMDDVIRYLRQCDEDVTAETDSADELLTRANRKRTSQGLPPFALLPVSPTQATRPDKPRQEKGLAPPRPPTARERAEWARRVVALE
jgi:hypothetical protein